MNINNVFGVNRYTKPHLQIDINFETFDNEQENKMIKLIKTARTYRYEED